MTPFEPWAKTRRDAPPQGIHLWNLWDMLRQTASDFLNLGGVILGMTDDVMLMGQVGFDRETVQRRLRVGLDHVKEQCKELSLAHSLFLVEELLKEERDYVEQELDLLFKSIRRELSDVLLIRVPSAQGKYYEKKDLFSEAASAKFPVALEEMQRAANCYALGQHTSCVFHAMRALEYGLRAMARSKDLGIAFKTEIEVENWKTILQQIEKRIREIEQSQAPSVLKANDLAFFSGGAAQFWHFKDAWRNHVSHTRAVYEEPQAKRVLDHAIEFFEHISTRLSE